jgi:hypothetical protein
VDYLEFKRSFEAELSKLKTPADCKVQEPDWEPLRVPLSWTVEMFLEFDDNNHIHIWESHDKFAGLYDSRRIAWSYHYGEITTRDEHSKIVQGPPGAPLQIRIDTCSGLHLHYGAREPHYQQERIAGLELIDVDAFRFMKAVFRHRRSGKSLMQTLGFKIKK